MIAADAIAADAMLRIAGGASRVLVGTYVADLADRGLSVDAALRRLLSATRSAPS
jgi:hypothetical protein